MNSPLRFLPLVVFGGAAIYLLTVALPPHDAEEAMHLQEFGKLPILDHGRLKPFDTLARNSLMVISGRQEFYDDDGNAHPAIEWLLDVMTSDHPFNNPAAGREKVFRIENDEVLNLLGLKPRSGLRYAIDEFRDKIPEIQEQAARADKVQARERTLFQEKILQLIEHLELYVGLAEMQTDTLRVIPPRGPQEDWKTFQDAFLEVYSTKKDNVPAREFGMVLLTYASGQPDRFNKAVAEYDRQLAHQLPGTVGKANFETFYNQFAPFYQCGVLYVIVFLLTAGAWLGWAEALNRSAFWLMVLTLVLHSWALVARMTIQHRPPVTNLYSSAVFIGWGAVVVGLILETIYRNGTGNLVGSVLGGLTMVIAHHLAGDGDTMEMLQAVLDTNFWLATHVTCVTIGYTATFVAGLLGAVYLVRGVLTRSLDRDNGKTLGQMLYGVVCFATLFSFTGTVLGGIWADQSWGRFWGWDPKENGALLIVLWNALILHARWCGLVKQRGMAVLAVIGNMITAWSWFGTNQLGVGLHSYGFNNQLALWLVAFWSSQLVLIALGLLPQRWWGSYAILNQIPERPVRKPRDRRPQAELASSV